MVTLMSIKLGVQQIFIFIQTSCGNLFELSLLLQRGKRSKWGGMLPKTSSRATLIRNQIPSILAIPNCLNKGTYYLNNIGWSQVADHHGFRLPATVEPVHIQRRFSVSYQTPTFLMIRLPNCLINQSNFHFPLCNWCCLTPLYTASVRRKSNSSEHVFSSPISMLLIAHLRADF